MTDFVLGLDVSTSVTGIVVVKLTSGKGFVSQRDIVLMEHEDFKGCKTLWEKADRMRDRLGKLGGQKVNHAYIEEPVKSFAGGQSSAQTIQRLTMFNGLVSYFVRETWKIDPEHIMPARARKLIGLKMQQKKTCGLSHKEQTFDAIMASDLSHHTWPTKRSGKPKDWAYDIVDAYVIAKAGVVLNT